MRQSVSINPKPGGGRCSQNLELSLITQGLGRPAGVEPGCSDDPEGFFPLAADQGVQKPEGAVESDHFGGC